MDESKLARVRALLAKAESTEFPAEAEALTAKAAELMATYGIEDAHLAATGEQTEPFVQHRIDITDPYSDGKAGLLSAVAVALRCRTIQYSYKGHRSVPYAVLFGYQSDVERVEMLYTSLLLQAASQVRYQRPDDTAMGRAESVSAYRRSWLRGFATAVRVRLQAAEKRAVAQHDRGTTAAPGTPSTDLVLIDRRAQVDVAFEEAFGKLKATKSRYSSANGYLDGNAAGRRADLNQTRLGGNRRALR
jgi:uncharacterized protein DUF2786